MQQPSAADNDVTSVADIRQRIVIAAAALIAAGGRDAATTRAVATAAGVQAPTIYRFFGDKRGLLDAVVEHGFAAYVAGKVMSEPNPDPVQELRDGWDTHIAFGLDNPGLYAILSGDPHPRARSPAVAAGLNVLHRRIRKIASAGRLRVSEERAVALVWAAGTGTVITLLSEPDERRDPELAKAAREMVVDAITSESISGAAPDHQNAATAMRARLNQTSVLTGGERQLMEELLDRIANG